MTTARAFLDYTNCLVVFIFAVCEVEGSYTSILRPLYDHLDSAKIQKVRANSNGLYSKVRTEDRQAYEVLVPWSSLVSFGVDVARPDGVH